MLFRRRELQLHLSECRQKQRECNIVGCKFWGNSRSLAEHNKDEAERHVSLLLIENRRLQEALLGAVSKMLYYGCLDIQLNITNIFVFQISSNVLFGVL